MMNKESQGEELSAEQFRRRLYSLFEKRGIVDHLKTQMRHLLVEELQECVPGGNILKRRASAVAAEDDNSLLLRAANSLVANHLQKCDYEYTMGIFIPESGTYPDKMFSMTDLLQLLRINPSSELYKRLVSQFASYSKKGFLWQLLCELSSLYTSATVSTSMQTDFMPQYSLSTLDEKLNGVERIYHSKKEKHNQNAMLGLEEKLVSLQRQLEKRYETELQLELTRMKENDLVTFRLEEKERCRKELELSKQELEKNYQLRLNALRERERNFTERLQKEEEMQLKETYIQRQSLLEEINALRERDDGITRTLEGINREKGLHEEKMQSQEELLRQKLNEVNRIELEYHQRLQNEINKFKMEEQKKILEKSQNLDKRENQVKTTELRIADDQMRMQSLKKELQDKNYKMNELETLLKDAHRNEATLVKNNDYLTEKLRENTMSRREFENEKIYHTETMQLNECLRTRQETFMKDSLQLNQEMACVKQEMEKVRNELSQEKALYENYKKQLEEKLQKEITQNRKLIQQCKEQTQEMKTLNEEMSEVQYKLLAAQKALNNEIAKKKKKICSRSLSSQHRIRDECFHRPLRTTRKARTRTVYQCLCSDDSCEEENSSCGLHSPMHGSGRDAGLSDEGLTNEDSSNIIAEIKYEKKMLEQQMKNIQHGYQCFQNRLKKGATPPGRTSTNDEAASENVLKKSKKKLEHLFGGQRDTSPVPSQIVTNSGSPSTKTLASTPCKESNNNKSISGKKGHSISVLPRFDISQLTGEDENRSVDEGSPVAAMISELCKTKGQENKVAEASALPTNPSSVMLPPTTAEEVLSSLAASPPIPDVCQTVSAPAPTSSFIPISVPFATSAFTQISAPSLISVPPSSAATLISASPLYSKHTEMSAHIRISTPPYSTVPAQISAPVCISTPPLSTAPAQISPTYISSACTRMSAPSLISPLPLSSAPFPTSAHTHISALAPVSTFVPVSSSPLSTTSSPPTIPPVLPVSATSVSPASISAPLSVAAPPLAPATFPRVSGLVPLSQFSSPAHSYLTEKSPLESLAVSATTDLPPSEHDPPPINTPAASIPFVSLDDAWCGAKKSEPSSLSYQSKSSNAEVSGQPKRFVQQEEGSQKTQPEQDNPDQDSVSSQNIPGLESSAKENLIRNPCLDQEDSSQIDTEIESDILPDSGSAHNGLVLDLLTQKKNELEKPRPTEDKPEHIESETEELHSDSLSQSHMSDSEVDDMFENW